MKTCTSCGRPPESVCQPCRDGNPPTPPARRTEGQKPRRNRPTLDLLAKLPDLAVEVAMTALIGAPNPGAERGLTRRSKPGSRPPLDLACVDAFHPTSGLLARLSDVRIAVCQEGEGPVPDPLEASTWAAEVDWLLAAAQAWQDGRELGEWVTSEVADIHRQLALLARTPQRKPDVCRTPGCGHPMHLGPGEAFYRCDAGHQHDGPRTLLTTYRRGRAMSAKEAREDPNLRLSPATISRAKARGDIKPARTDVVKGRRVDFWLPWDLVGLVHPDLVRLVEEREAGGDAA
ncbi:hypothetical protein DT076_16675 [Desertihabitans brevis]|uniref:Uncharacterized protein n=1 Tax=Desertihabitans brevis TaxID=2268447 RepID=A0A367YTH5_9ACTN|nr:hypothetical protein [Desertihabitans brevis]RCK68281.1 hypothetical protein DT076_16675 [Desertihabitans brevis]